MHKAEKIAVKMKVKLKTSILLTSQQKINDRIMRKM